jgi:GT2 family glycosyltransferase
VVSALDATVVLVNYEGRGKLGRCLDGLARMHGPSFETVVVDNASRDGSWDEAEGRENVRLIRNRANVGFGRACNQGAAGSQARYVAFLNFDSVPEPGWLAELVAVADANPDAPAVQGLILVDPGEEVMSAGNRAHYLGFSWAPIGTGPVHDVPYEIPTGCGAALLVRRDRFEDVGGFWDGLFLYHEDFDLCWRLRLRGGRVLLAPSAVSHHLYEFARNPTKHFHMERGRLLVMGANYQAGTLLALLPALLLTELAILVVAARQGWLGQKLGSLASVARALPALRRERRRVQEERLLPDREILRVFESGLGGEFGAGVARATAPLLALYARLAGVPTGGAAAAAVGSP